MRRALTGAAAAALLLVASGSAAQAPPAGADDCLAALEQAERDARTPAFLGDHCPELGAALAASPWGRALPPDAAYYLTREQLATFVAVTEQYRAGGDARLPVDSLEQIVAGLEPFVPEEEPSLWDLIAEWFDRWFGAETEYPTWLAEWLESLSIPQSWARVMLFVSAGLVVLAALAVLINELRAGGVFSGRARRAFRAAAAEDGEIAAAPGFDAIRRVPSVGRRIELLLKLVVERLRQRDRGALSVGLTHRELERTASGLDPAEREALHTVVGSAERVTYAGWTPDEAEFDAVWTSGESLVRRLDDETGGRA